MSDDDHVLKVPRGSSVGMTPALYDHLEENGRLELFGTATIPGRGTVTGDDPAAPEFDVEHLGRVEGFTARESTDSEPGPLLVISGNDGGVSMFAETTAVAESLRRAADALERMVDDAEEADDE